MIGDSLPSPTSTVQLQNTIDSALWSVSALEIVLNCVEEAIVRTTIDGVICWHNQAFVHLIDPEKSKDTVLNYCGESLIEKLPLTYQRKPLSDREHPLYLALSDSLVQSQYELNCNGKILILDIQGLKLEDSQLKESILFVIRDRTEYKLIERLVSMGYFSVEESSKILDPQTLGAKTPDSQTLEVANHCDPNLSEYLHQNLLHLNSFYESVVAQLSNYAAVGRLAHLFTQMMVQLKIHEQESQKAKDKLHAVLNAVPGLISWIRSDETYLGVNFHLAKMFNLVPNDFIGKKLGFIKEETRMNEFLRSFITSSQSYDSTTVELQIDHDLRHYIIAVQKYDEGNAIVVVGIDITEQKHVEKALSIAEENYRSIFENSLEGIFQSTLQGQYIRVNPALAKIYGYDSPEDMITTISNIGEQIYVDLEERQAFIRCLDQQDTVKGVEYRCYKKDGSIIWVQVDARVVRDQSGQIAYYEGTVQDITDRKKREAELQQQITNLKIEIDHQKREEEVLNLTATSYFQQVKQEIEEIDLDEFWS